MRVVCVGTPQARRYLSSALAESNYSVTGLELVEDAAYVASLASAPPVHAVIVLAPADLLATVSTLATRPAYTVLVLIARDDNSDTRAAALEAGADICLPAGYDYAELDARLRAFARGALGGDAVHAAAAGGSLSAIAPVAPLSGSSEDGTSNSPGIAVTPSKTAAAADITQREQPALPQLSPATRSIAVPGGPSLLLRQREYLLLDCLSSRPGQTIAYDDLLDYVFGNADADVTSLHQLVSRLRPRLAGAGLRLRLEADPGRGYRVHAQGQA